MTKIKLKYVPHGIDPRVFRPVDTDEDRQKLAELRFRLFGTQDVDFVVSFNSRNMIRKRPSSVIMAYDMFYRMLTTEQQQRTRLLLHTQQVDNNGTDLPAVVRDCAPGLPVVFTNLMFSQDDLNLFYNLTDLYINISHAEGFGLTSLEAIMAGRMVLLNSTGGLQDQCGFLDEQGQFLHEDFTYCAEWGTNADGRYKEHGEWVLPVFPTARSLIGSPPTPYIYDDYCSIEDVARQIHKAYYLTSEERTERGLAGRAYAQSVGMDSASMCESLIAGIDRTLATWEPPAKFALYKF